MAVEVSNRSLLTESTNGRLPNVENKAVALPFDEFDKLTPEVFNPRHLDGIVKLLNLPEVRSHLINPPENIGKLLEKTEDPFTNVFYAVDDQDTVVSTVTISDRREMQGGRFLNPDLETFAVHPDYQGQGIGVATIECVLHNIFEENPNTFEGKKRGGVHCAVITRVSGWEKANDLFFHHFRFESRGDIRDQVELKDGGTGGLEAFHLSKRDWLDRRLAGHYRHFPPDYEFAMKYFPVETERILNDYLQQHNIAS